MKLEIEVNEKLVHEIHQLQHELENEKERNKQLADVLKATKRLLVERESYIKKIRENQKACECKHAHWIENNCQTGYDWYFTCSNCGWVDNFPLGDRHKYCPECGAKMHEEE